MQDNSTTICYITSSLPNLLLLNIIHQIDDNVDVIGLLITCKKLYNNFKSTTNHKVVTQRFERLLKVPSDVTADQSKSVELLPCNGCNFKLGDDHQILLSRDTATTSQTSLAIQCKCIINRDYTSLKDSQYLQCQFSGITSLTIDLQCLPSSDYFSLLTNLVYLDLRVRSINLNLEDERLNLGNLYSLQSLKLWVSGWNRFFQQGSSFPSGPQAKLILPPNLKYLNFDAYHLAQTLPLGLTSLSMMFHAQDFKEVSLSPLSCLKTLKIICMEGLPLPDDFIPPTVENLIFDNETGGTYSLVSGVPPTITQKY
ncbi:hypothetical protein DFA_08658 [Cavenderia fasciculata]|uniref:F-box domain-containing protein n=1 Tax=Cavenderia fasciculata TaxID=261658 RepID=F4Q3K4_CACFS|nr:uncharacterized protein DFA_08658 [Cavenderia fasciculata]EGG17662.1 hypothetical protein DFA_08658 [Cavenderia fasciculata]|eukprot:XP_004356146.1 hypothetical protein DFA_08658 [Cavenderia fasciculata]